MYHRDIHPENQGSADRLEKPDRIELDRIADLKNLIEKKSIRSSSADPY
jgi:hypothetical protein